MSVEDGVHVPASDWPAFRDAVAAALRCTEPGDLVTYGELAEEAGFPRQARRVSRVLNVVEDLPWWRVVPASGRLPEHLQPRQREHLAREGVVVGDDLRLPRGPRR